MKIRQYSIRNVKVFVTIFFFSALLIILFYFSIHRHHSIDVIVINNSSEDIFLIINYEGHKEEFRINPMGEKRMRGLIEFPGFDGIIQIKTKEKVIAITKINIPKVRDSYTISISRKNTGEWKSDIYYH